MKIRETVYSHEGQDALNRKKHNHKDSVEIIQILSGDGNFLVDDTLYPLARGAVLIIDSNSLHCSIPSDAAPYIRNSLTVDKSQLLLLCSLADVDANEISKTRYTVTDEETLTRISSLFEAIHLLSADDNWQTLILLSEILSLCLNEKKAKNSNDPMLSYINGNLDKNLSLEDIANAMHFSKYHFCRVFKQRTGMTPMSYIRLRRIAHAKDLLKNTDMSVSEVALACGYDNFSFFCQIFKNAEGMSPSAYRNKHRSK